MLMCEACVFVAALCLSVCIVVFAVVGVVLVSFFFSFAKIVTCLFVPCL